MARVSSIEENDHPELAGLIERLRSGRRGTLLNLYRLLLHSPDVAQTWFEHSNAIRWKTDVDGRLRELVIVRIGLLYNVDYILKQHVPNLTAPEGISAGECAALADWKVSTCFSERERAGLAYADAMSRDITVSNGIFAELAHHFSERQVVELTLLIGMFNMAARVMKALQIDPQPQAPDTARHTAVSSSSSSSRVQSKVETKPPIIVVEDDWFTRMVGIVLDPTTTEERRAAFADFFFHDAPDFEGYCNRLRASVPGLFPSQVQLVDSVDEMRAQLAGARILVVESFPVGRAELDAGGDLAVVQKFGSVPRNIDMQSCAERGITVLTVRRRSSMACAEMAVALMLTLAKKIYRLAGRISPDQLAGEGGLYRPFDRRHTANSNWARVPGLRMLNESTFGIIGIGEIGREIVLRLAGFGMRMLYHQRTRLPEIEERALGVTYVQLEELLEESDWIIPQLPGIPANRHFIDSTRFAQMKRGAFLVNISRAELVDREALIEALKSGRLGGFALDPLYESPGRSDDELLRFPNVVLTPHIAAQPRFNVLNDMADMIAGMARAVTQNSRIGDRS